MVAHSLAGDSGYTYEGAFLVVAVAAAAVVLAVVTVPRGITARLLALPPLPWIGRISYGMYLWHFPLYIYLSPVRTGLSGAPLAAVRVGTTIAISAASFYAVERPIMEHRFWRSARALVPAGAGAVAVSAIVIAATLGPAASEATTTGHHYQPSGTTNQPPPPARVVVLGDSTAITLSYALHATAPQGTDVVDGGLFGCGLAIASATSADPPHPGLTLPPPCNSATPTGRQWPAVDTRLVALTRPGDVVLFLAGHDDTQGTLEHGAWTSILSPSFQQGELTRLRQLVTIATGHGAHLDLLTMPCTDSNFEFGTAPSPTDSANRRELFNKLLVKTAAAHPSTVSLIDYGSILCPTGRFTATLAGVQVRALDGIHTPAYAPGNPYAGNSTAEVAGRFYSWLAPRLWPKIISSGR